MKNIKKLFGPNISDEKILQIYEIFLSFIESEASISSESDYAMEGYVTYNKVDLSDCKINDFDDHLKYVLKEIDD